MARLICVALAVLSGCVPVGTPTPAEPVAPKVDCNTAPLSADRVQSAMAEDVWLKPLVAVTGRVKGCEGARLDLYDPVARRWLSRTPLPFPGTLSPITGRYIGIPGYIDTSNQQVFIDTTTGQLVLDTRTLRSQLGAYGEKLFTRPSGHYRVSEETIVMDLNDGRKLWWTEDGYEANEISAPSIEDTARRHGCSGLYNSGRDAFKGPTRKQPYVRGMDTVSPGFHRIDFTPEGPRTRISATDASGQRLLRSVDTYFFPQVLKIAPCTTSVRRPQPAPLLIQHRGHLDRDVAPVLLSRLDRQGAPVWTVTLPFEASVHTGARYFDQTLFMFNAQKHTGVWVDLEAGKLLGTEQFDQGWTP
ncbi:MAG: hypothetical protein ACE366_18510 [Bradymonadia bacterium]